MKRWMSLFLAMLLMMSMAMAESSDLPAGTAGMVEWICPSCGQEGNTGNFCPNCATARPEADGNGIQVPEEPEINENLTQIPGETDWVSVNILRIDDSGYIKAKKDQYRYASWNAVDEDINTCWQFSTKKIKKSPPWVCLVVEGETVDGIWVRNGFQSVDAKGKDLYPQYSRMKDVTVVFVYTDGEKESDRMTFTLEDENTGDWDRLETGRHEDVDLVWFYIDSVYKGKSANCCMTEIRLVQNTPAERAMPSWR